MIILYLLSMHACANSKKELIVLKGILATENGRKTKREVVRTMKEISPIILPLGAIGVTREIKFKIDRDQRIIYDIEDGAIKYRFRFNF